MSKQYRKLESATKLNIIAVNYMLSNNIYATIVTCNHYLVKLYSEYAQY